ncbi:hypothetical protein ACO22_06734 [Paracoccidioides brasiliensis]|uniref:Uncharacterized protein n=1 Tax=Paracoccidioides brasiliensis TaxID=121759 RepID=A0A1D2J6M6_PARBR|nr:hypothetical protein ACO22_06734 [Paracoccidioides brasiliensis]ODH46607.1 hypothetical protein GX48_07302 [Paracoccidioides brasiliensis]
MLNDTGSHLLSIFGSDLMVLGIPANYNGYGPLIPINAAIEIAQQPQIYFEINLLTPQGDVASDWVHEEGVGTPDTMWNRASPVLFKRRQEIIISMWLRERIGLLNSLLLSNAAISNHIKRAAAVIREG